MSNNRDFKKEYDIFQQKFPYQTTVVDGIEVRYQYGGNEDAPVLFFFPDIGPVSAKWKLNTRENKKSKQQT